MATTFEATLLYKCFPPGTVGGNPGPGGHVWKSASARTQAEADILAKDGWSVSLEGPGGAIENYDLATPLPDSSQLPSAATPEERAAAADVLQAEAADALTQANETLAADQVLASDADKAFEKVLEEFDQATEAKADFDARYKDLLDRKAAAAATLQNANKTLASSKLRAAAADRALDDAAVKVITLGSLLTNAKQKALDAAAAKQKALAKAEAKETAPPTTDVPAPVQDAPTPIAPAQPGVRAKKTL